MENPEYAQDFDLKLNIHDKSKRKNIVMNFLCAYSVLVDSANLKTYVKSKQKLFFHSCSEKIGLDKIIVVQCPPNIRIAQLIRRNYIFASGDQHKQLKLTCIA